MAGASGSLTRIWTNKSIKRKTKVRIYEVLVTSLLLYNSGTWTLKEKEKQRLRVFEMAVLRNIAGVTRQDRKRNDDVMTELGLTMEIIDRIQQKWLRYFGHVVRMKNYRLPKIALYGRVNGTRPPEARMKSGNVAMNNTGMTTGKKQNVCRRFSHVLPTE